MCSACSCHEIKQATSPTMEISLLFQHLIGHPMGVGASGMDRSSAIADESKGVSR
jgi:hypothetical protein